MKNFKYFNYGYSQNPKWPVYALYQPTIDCFLHVVDDLAVANQLRFLLSSRYQIVVCDVSRADNYYPTIIDNEICENWSLTNKGDIKFYHMYLSTMPVFAEGLCSSQLKFSWDTDYEKQWILLCSHWVKFVNDLKDKTYYDIAVEIDRVENLHNTADYPRRVVEPLEKEIMNLLYLGQDIKDVDYRITQLTGGINDSSFYLKS